MRFVLSSDSIKFFGVHFTLGNRLKCLIGVMVRIFFKCLRNKLCEKHLSGIHILLLHVLYVIVL